MRINCPICGARDRREFYYKGSADYLSYPTASGDADKDMAAIHAYLHLRENPAGVTRDLWHHDAGCAAWLVVERNITTHQVLGVALASDVKRGRT